MMGPALFEPPTSVVEYQSRIGFPLLSVPTIVIFENGGPIGQISGRVDDWTDKLERFAEVQNTRASQRGDSPVIRGRASDISDIAKRMSADKPLFLTLSSPDLGCPPCIIGNANVQKVAPSHANKWAFAEVHYNPWQSFGDDPALKLLMAETGFKVKGLPTSLLFFQGKYVAQITSTLNIDALLETAHAKVLATH